MPCCPETTFSSRVFIPSAPGKACWLIDLHCELPLEMASTEEDHLTRDKVLRFLESHHPMTDRLWGIKTRLLCQFGKPLKGHFLVSISQWSVTVFFVTIIGQFSLKLWTELHHTPCLSLFPRKPNLWQWPSFTIFYYMMFPGLLLDKQFIY